MGKLVTSESVSCGHPDKVADQISDTVVDEFLKADPLSRVAVETLVSTGLVVVAGEVSERPKTQTVLGGLQRAIRRTISCIGYNDPKLKFDAEGCSILLAIHGQSSNIAQGVDIGGAGDQGIMYGYACNETKDMMPLTAYIANALMRKHKHARTFSLPSVIRPDAKSQVTVEYDDDGKPVRIDTIILSTQHTPEYSQKQEDLHQLVVAEIIGPALVECGWPIKKDSDIKIIINPTGCFEIGGPHGDTGVTGRKIIVDTYGGIGRHGGGAFSGKDPTKVDRTATYMARYIAKNIVGTGCCSACEIQLAYAIGLVEPVSVYVDVTGPDEVKTLNWEEIVKSTFPLRPRLMIDHLRLRQTSFKSVASGCHFGGDEYAWEQLDKVEELKSKLS